MSNQTVWKNPWSGRLRTLLVILSSTALALSATLPAQAVEGTARSTQPAPRPGAWTQLGAEQGGSTAALLHVANGNDLVVWVAALVSNKHYYAAAELRPKGGMASRPVDTFGGHDWGSLDQDPTLVSQGGQPLLIFEGGRSLDSTDPYHVSCIFGDLRTPRGWQLQSWSLSANCTNPTHFGATITRNGTLSAAWPGGWANGIGIRYRFGVSPTIPATPDDQHLSTAPGGATQVAEATETRSQDVYAAWDRIFSQPASKDGLWVADLSRNPKPLQAPGTGTNTNHLYEPVAIASSAGRGGIYLAYPNNVWPFTGVELWRYGARAAVAVPGARSPMSVSLSAGPSGRLWIAWWSASNGTVSVVRTNEAGNAFGPVKTYAGPRGCQGDGSGTIKISSGAQQRLDVVMACYGLVSPGHSANLVFATQSLVPLQITATTFSINHQTGGAVTYRVTDVGDAVSGARVRLDGRSGKTDGKGQITFHFPKGARTGSFRVVASRAGYLKASTSLTIR